MDHLQGLAAVRVDAAGDARVEGIQHHRLLQQVHELLPVCWTLTVAFNPSREMYTNRRQCSHARQD